MCALRRPRRPDHAHSRLWRQRWLDAARRELRRGKALYTSLTCDGCHTLTGIRATGPTFRGLAGSQVKLKSGKTVTADDDYLFESIETPNKEIVASFSALMEAVIKPHSVSERDARDLIAFIKTVR